MASTRHESHLTINIDFASHITTISQFRRLQLTPPHPITFQITLSCLATLIFKHIPYSTPIFQHGDSITSVSPCYFIHFFFCYGMFDNLPAFQGPVPSFRFSIGWDIVDTLSTFSFNYFRQPYSNMVSPLHWPLYRQLLIFLVILFTHQMSCLYPTI